ncbi:MAG: beta-glucuronidase, partial [Acidimicrobiia bacterium]|nr:beta-glucuronidase [Acidimicrobiia bacterium]
VELVGLDRSVEVDLVAAADGHRYTGRFELDPIGVRRWALGEPVLHPVRYRLDVPATGSDTAGGEGDVVDDEVGFRTVATEGTDILVNDEPVFLLGISLHGEGPTGGRRAHGDDDAATLLGWVDDLHANFARLAHYQHDEAMVRTADRLGLMVWCEVPVYWGIDFANPATKANALAQLTELVVRDRSRASVLLWSVANETLPGPDRNDFLAALAARTRALDPTRLVTAALFTHPPAGQEVTIDDPLGVVVDVIGVNQYLGWYYGERADIASTSWTSGFAKPIVFSELGAAAKAGRHGDDDEIWTEEFQAAVYVEQLKMIERCDACAGLSPWILKDFRTPVRVLPEIQDGYNRKGLMSEEGERKLAFDVVRSFYAARV